MKRVFLLLGTNIGDRPANLKRAILLIGQRVGKIMQRSAIYETSAWGKTDQSAFLNQAIEITTALDAEQVLNTILAIEIQLGRKRSERWGERIIDIDILLFGDKVSAGPSLVIPHPQLPNRRFTLVPLNEIAPDFIHPIFHKTISELLFECIDELAVAKYAEGPGL